MERLPKDAIQGPQRADWGSKDAATAAYWAQRTAAYHGIVTWSPTIDPEALKTAVHADGGRGQGAPAAARLGARADPRGQRRQGRHLREQGGPPRHPRQGGDRHDRRCRPDRAHARLLRVRHRRGRHPPLHQHRVPVRRRRHGALARLPPRRARGLLRVHGARAARSSSSSRSRSCPGATTSRCSWARGCRATAPSTSRTSPRSSCARASSRSATSRSTAPRRRASPTPS